MLKSKSCIAPSSMHGARFDTAAAELFPDVSRKKIKKIIDSGGAYLNKKRVKIAKIEIKANDKIEIFWEETAADQNLDNHVVHKKSALSCSINMQNIIFENDHFFIVNKPAGIATQATLTSSTDTIFHMLHNLDAQKFKLEHMFMVHRLDKDTSGLLIVARNKKAQAQFEDMFRTKNVKKVYDALCFEVPKNKVGEINFPIAKDRNRPNCYYALTRPNAKSKEAKEAKTAYELVQKFTQNASLIRCFPHTGRTHQIRVHLSAIGCPIVGDKTYAQNIYGHPLGQSALRHMLHASELSFELSGEKFEFKTELPGDFMRILENLTAL